MIPAFHWRNSVLMMCKHTFQQRNGLVDNRRFQVCSLFQNSDPLFPSHKLCTRVESWIQYYVNLFAIKEWLEFRAKKMLSHIKRYNEWILWNWEWAWLEHKSRTTVQKLSEPIRLLSVCSNRCVCSFFITCFRISRSNPFSTDANTQN